MIKTVLLISFFAIFVWSGMHPHDYFTWVLEVFPAIIGLVVLLLTYKKFKFTDLVYTLFWIHAIILLVGGHYTYEKIPLFDWVKEWFHFSRNHYDRLGHFAQGFVPAMVTREIVIRKNIINGKGWRFFFIVCTCLAISALYELFEWWVSVATGTAAQAFLGTQGDVWDTQWDMFFALVGSIIALLTLSKFQDRQIASAIPLSPGR